MATDFPTSLDTLTNPNANDTVDTVSHADQHANANDAIEALEAKVGANSSAVTTSHDFKLSDVADGDKTASLTGSETLTNKTLTEPVIASVKPSGGNTQTVPDATSTLADISTAQTLTNKTLTAPALTNPVLNGVISGSAFLDEDDLVSDSPTAVPSQQSVKAYVDNTIASGGAPDVIGVGLANTGAIRYSDEAFRVGTVAASTLRISTVTSGRYQAVTPNAVWAGVDTIPDIFITSGFLFYFGEDNGTTPDTFRIYRYDLSNLVTAPTLATFAGSNQLAQTDNALRCAFDGTTLYITYEGGNSANQYDIAKYTLSGTVFTYVSTVSLSDTDTHNLGIAVDASGNIYTIDTTKGVRQYNSTGTLQWTSLSGIDALINFGGTMYELDGNEPIATKALF